MRDWSSAERAWMSSAVRRCFGIATEGKGRKAML